MHYQFLRRAFIIQLFFVCCRSRLNKDVLLLQEKLESLKNERVIYEDEKM